MRIGVLGSGEVARTLALATGFRKHGHDVLVGTRDPGTLRDWPKANARVGVDRFADAANAGAVRVLAVRLLRG